MWRRVALEHRHYPSNLSRKCKVKLISFVPPVKYIYIYKQCHICLMLTHERNNTAHFEKCERGSLKALSIKYTTLDFSLNSCFQKFCPKLKVWNETGRRRVKCLYFQNVYLDLAFVPEVIFNQFNHFISFEREIGIQRNY